MSEEFPWCSYVDSTELKLLEKSTTVPIVKKFPVFERILGVEWSIILNGNYEYMMWV
jgi:hypothetical protein